MNKKTIFIVGGVVAALGIGYYLWTKRKKDSKVGSTEEAKKPTTDESSKTMATTESEKKVQEFTPEQKAKIEELKTKISECEEQMKSAKIPPNASPCTPLKQQYDILTNKQSADAFKSKIGNIGAVLSKTAQKLNAIKPILSRGTKDE
jgi:hypothetical protein